MKPQKNTADNERFGANSGSHYADMNGSRSQNVQRKPPARNTNIKN